MRLLTIVAILFAILAIVSPNATLSAQGTQPPANVGPTLKLLRIDLGCYPHLPPDDSQGNGCGFDDFIRFLREVINYLTIIVFPLAAAMFVWGGLMIMTAAGSMERVSKGRQILWTAVIGVSIALGAWLIINAIYLALTGTGV